MPWSTYGSDGQRKYLTRDETDRFLGSARNETQAIHFFCWFVVATGCRISEALNITVHSLDFEAGLVIIESLKKRRSGVYRAVPLPSLLMDMLNAWIRSSGLERDQRLWPWSRMTGYRRITEVMEKANIAGPWATPKGLRHAFGVRAVQSGAPLHMVQRWLGHADMKTTAIYASAVGPEERELAARTWLNHDVGEAAGTPATLPSPERESARPMAGSSPPSRAYPRSESASGDLKKPWFWRLFGRNRKTLLAY